MDHAEKWLRMKKQRRAGSRQEKPALTDPHQKTPAVTAGERPLPPIEPTEPAERVPGGIYPPPNTRLMDLWREWQAGQKVPQRSPKLLLADENDAPPLDLEQLPSESMRCTVRLLTAANEHYRTSHTEGGKQKIPANAKPILYLAHNRMAAWIMVFPPVGGGKPVEMQELWELLDAYMVISGVDSAALRRIADNQLYFQIVLVACGTPPGKSQDGFVEEFFPREPHMPQSEEMRIAAILNPEYLAKIGKGTPLCHRTPARPGTPGRDVQDTEVPSAPVKEGLLLAGKNTAITDGETLAAATEGYLYFEDGRFHVQPTYTVEDGLEEDADTIDFDGDVWIMGDVLRLNVIRASGSVVIWGSMENSYVQADKNVMILTGVVGEDEATIRAGESVSAKYLEHCIVYAGKAITSECAICAYLYSDDHISITSGRGVTVGGSIVAAHYIEAKIVGSQSERSTQITLGEYPCRRESRQEIELRLNNIREEMESLRKIMSHSDRQQDESLRMIAQSKYRLRLTGLSIKERRLVKQLNAIEVQLSDYSACYLRSDTVYPKTVVTIGPGSFCTAETLSRCTFKLVGKNIRAYGS
jgi:uncharacterized protein (DUF342 family)